MKGQAKLHLERVLKTFYVVAFIIRQCMTVKRSTVFMYRCNTNKIETDDIMQEP